MGEPESGAPGGAKPHASGSSPRRSDSDSPPMPPLQPMGGGGAVAAEPVAHQSAVAAVAVQAEPTAAERAMRLAARAFLMGMHHPGAMEQLGMSAHDYVRMEAPPAVADYLLQLVDAQFDAAQWRQYIAREALAEAADDDAPESEEESGSEDEFEADDNEQQADADQTANQRAQPPQAQPARHAAAAAAAAAAASPAQAAAGGGGGGAAAAAAAAADGDSGEESGEEGEARDLTPEERLNVELLHLVSLSQLDENAPLFFSLAHPAFPVNPHPPGSPQWQHHGVLYTAEFEAACLPLLVEFPTIDAANKAWDALIRAHSKEKTVRLVPILMLLLSHAYFLTQFRIAAPNAFHSFCHYGLREVTRTLLVSPFFVPPATNDRDARLHSFRLLLIYLHVAQSASLRLLESLPSPPPEPLFEVLELTLNAAHWKAVKAWVVRLESNDAMLVRQWMHLPQVALALQGANAQHIEETKEEVMRLKVARQQRRQQYAVAAAAASAGAAAAAAPRVPGGVPARRTGATVETLDDEEVQIVSPPGHSAPLLPSPGDGTDAAPADAEMAPATVPPTATAAVAEGASGVSKFTLKLPSKDDALLVAAIHDAPNRLSAQLAADLADDDGSDGQGDTEMTDAPLPPQRPPPPNEQMPLDLGADDDVRAQAGSDNDEVCESGAGAPSIRGNRDGEYDDESVEGRESNNSMDDEVQLADDSKRHERAAPAFEHSSPVSSRSPSPVTPSPSPQTEQNITAADPTLMARSLLYLTREFKHDVCNNLLLHFFSIGGPRRLLDLLTRCTPQSSAPAAAPADATSSSSGASAAAATAAASSTAPIRDYPPIVHTSFAAEILDAAIAAGAAPATVPALITPDCIQHTVHLTCPPLMLLRRVVGLLQLIRQSMRADLQAVLLCRLFHFIAPRIQFMTESQLKVESSAQLAMLLASFAHLYESAYFYAHFHGNMVIAPDPSLLHPSKMQLELFEIELAVRLLRCTFLEKRIQGLKYLSRFLEPSDASQHRVAAHPENLAVGLLATSKLILQTDTSSRRAPVVICGDTAAQTMVRYKLVDILFGEQLHIQVLKRADMALRELAHHDALSAAHIELMWTASRGKHESVVQAIFHIFEHFTDRLKPRPAVYLYRRIYALPLAEYDRHLIKLITLTTRQLLGNHTSTYLWCHAHQGCTLQKMSALWTQHQADKKAAAQSGQTSDCVLPSLPGVGVKPDLADPLSLASWVYLTHSAAAPRLPFDDYPPGAPVPPLEPGVQMPDDSSIRPAKNEYFGIDLLWRGFNLGNGDGSIHSVHGGGSAGDKNGSGSGENGLPAPVASLPAGLRDQCFSELKPMLLWPLFEDPRPTCARRLEYIMLCFKNVQRSHNVYHSLQLMRELIETFAQPRMWEKLRDAAVVGSISDDRFKLVQWLNATRGGIGAALFTELSTFSRAVQQRITQPIAPDADSHSLAFWDGPAAQLQRRLDSISYIFGSLRKASLADAKAEAAAPAAQPAPMAVDGETAAAAPATDADAAADATAPTPGSAPVSPPQPPSNPFLLFERNVSNELFEQWLLPASMSDDLRDVVFSWLSQCLLDGLVSDELLLRVFHHSIPRLNFASLTSLGLQFVLQAFRRINIRAHKLVGDPPAAAFRSGAPNVHRRINLSARVNGDNFRVVAYPLDGVDYLWSAALHAQDRAVSNAATAVLMRLHKNIDAPLRAEINVRYEEAIARCMKHVSDCTTAIQKSSDSDTEMITDAATEAAAATGARMSVADLVADLGRGFSLLNNFLQHGEGDKPMSHEARLKQATAPPLSAQAAAAAAAPSGSSSGDLLILEVRSSPDVPRFQLRLPSHNSVRELKLAFLTLLGLTAGSPDDVTMLLKGTHVVDSTSTLASLDIGDAAISLSLKPTFKESVSGADWAEAIARVNKHVAEMEAGQALASSFVSASTVATVEAATTLSTALVAAPTAVAPAAPIVPTTLSAAPVESKEQEEEKEAGAPAAAVAAAPTAPAAVAADPSPPATAAAPAPVIHHPSTILSRPEYFQQLFDLLSLSVPASSLPASSARSSHIAEHAWKLLMQLPTNAQMLQRLKALSCTSHATTQQTATAALHSGDKIQWDVLLPRDSLHQLHYSLQIIFSIIPHHNHAAAAPASAVNPSAAPATTNGHATVGSQPGAWDAAEWESAFVARGGLRHLIHILVENDFSLRTGAVPSLQPAASPMPTTPSNATAATAAGASTTSQCQQTFECLALLLKIILRFTHPHTHVQAAAADADGTATTAPVSAAASDQHQADGTRKRKAAADPAVLDPQQSKRRAVEQVQSDSFSSELQSVFTYEVVHKLFQLWLEVASMPQVDPSAALAPLPPQPNYDVTIIGPTLPRNNSSHSGGPAAAAFRAAAASDVMYELVRDSLQMLTNILTRDSSSGIARQFFFQGDAVSLWLHTLLTSSHNMKESAEHLVSIARFWSHQLAASPLPHLSRFIFHAVLDLLLSPEHSATLMHNRYHSSSLMAVPINLLQLLQAEMVAASALSKEQMTTVLQWSVRSLQPLSEAGARTLAINGLELSCQLFAKLKSYPLVEGFDDLSSDETLIGYLDFASQVVAALTVTPPPKLLPAAASPAPVKEEEAKGEAAPIGPATATTAASAAAATSSAVVAAPRAVNVLPPNSLISKLVEVQDWISFVYNECLFQVRRVLTPLDVPLAADLPRCKHFNTRNRAFNLLRHLAQTSRTNFIHLQRMAIGSQHNRSGEGLGFSYAPDTRKKHGHYVGLVNQGATCYMNSLMQQLYMVPEFRFGVLAQLSTDVIEDEADRADSLMFQLQAIFANLMDSDDASYDAAGFCAAYKDYDGQPMAKGVQMDVNEFFNVLFEKLEQSLKGSPHANLLDHAFGGTLSNQLLGRESGCSHQRSRDENFYILSLDVKGKKNVSESLKSFVEGEMLEGDNKFLCGECQRKVDTLKRVCIKNTPNNLILHLKRFEFDLDSMMKIKINDEFQFPLELDLYDYTIEGLEAAAAAKEEAAAKGDADKTAQTAEDTKDTAGVAGGAEEGAGASAAGGAAASASASSAAAASSSAAAPASGDRVDRSDYLYELAGVIVHQGLGAGSGHYYSYAMERCPLPQQDHSVTSSQWLCFNDTRVEPFNISQLGDSCFGGSSFEGGEWYHKPYSAYMLFYQKKSIAHKPHAPLVCPIPRDMQPAAVAEEAREVDAVHAAVQAAMPAHLPSAVETFTPLAKRVGLTVQGHNDAPMESVTSPHKRKHPSSDAESNESDGTGESSPAEKGSAAPSEQQEEEAEEAEEDPLSPEDKERRLHCARYRSLVATAPVTSLRRCVTLEEQSSLLPASLFDQIWRSNTDLSEDVFHFDSYCLDFIFTYVVQYAYDFSVDLSDRELQVDVASDKLQMRSIQLAVHFLCCTLIHARAKSALVDWEGSLKRMLRCSVAASRYFLSVLTNDIDLCVRALLACTVAAFKKSFAAVILAALETIRPLEAAHLLEYNAPPKSKPASVQEEAQEEEQVEEDAHARKKQRVADADGEDEGATVPDVDMKDAAPPAEGETEATAAESEEEEEEEEEEEARYRTTVSGRFIGALLEVSPLTLNEHYQRSSQWWHLLYEIASLGAEECELMLLKYDTPVLAVLGLLGADAAVEPGVEYDEESGAWTGLKKLRIKKKLSIKAAVQLMALLLSKACTEGRLDSGKLHDLRRTRKAFEDVGGLWDLLLQSRDDLELIAPVQQLLACVCTGRARISDKLTQRLATEHVQEFAVDLQFSLEWMAALMAIPDESQKDRVHIVCKSLMVNFKETDAVKYARELLRAIEWTTERMRQLSDDAFFIKEYFIVSGSFFKHCLPWLIAELPPGLRRAATDLLRALASETDQERQLREQKAQEKAAAAAAAAAQPAAAVAAAPKAKAKAAEAKEREGEGEEAEDDEEEEDDEDEEDALYRPHPTRRELLLVHLQSFIARLSEIPPALTLPPRLEELWRLTRELCVTTAEKVALLAHPGVLDTLRRILPLYNQANRPYDPSRLELVMLLEHLLYVTKPDQVLLAEAKQREADAIAKKKARIEAKAAAAAASAAGGAAAGPVATPPPALLPIRSLHLSTEQIVPNWIALSGPPDLAAQLANTSITIQKAGTQANGSYLENTLGRVWQILRTMLDHKPVLASYIAQQQPYQWGLPNLVIKEAAYLPRLEALCSHPDGLFCHLLRLSDQLHARSAAAAQPIVPPFREFCMKDWFTSASEGNDPAHKLNWLRQRRLLPTMIKYVMMLLRTDEHADQDAAAFVKYDCFFTLAPLLHRWVKDDDGSYDAHFPALVQLLWQLYGRHADACRRALQEAREAKQVVALPLATLPVYVRSFKEAHTSRTLDYVVQFAIWLMHWWESNEEPPAEAAPAKPPAPRTTKPTVVEVAAAAAAAGAAAGAAAAPAAPIRSQSTAAFPGLAAVRRVDDATRQRLHDILLVCACGDRGFAEFILNELTTKRLARYVLDASADERTTDAGATGGSTVMEDAQMSDAPSATAAASAAPSSSPSTAPAYALLCGRSYVHLIDELAQVLLPVNDIQSAQEVSRALILTLLEYHKRPSSVGVSVADLESLCAHLASLHAAHGLGCNVDLLLRLWEALFDVEPRLMRHLDSLALDSLIHGGPFIDPAPEDPSPQAQATRQQAMQLAWTWPDGQRRAMLGRALRRLQTALGAAASAAPSDLLNALHPVSLLQRYASAASAASAAAAAAAPPAESPEAASFPQELHRWSQQHAQLLVAARPALDAALASLLPAQPHLRDALQATLAALV